MLVAFSLGSNVGDKIGYLSKAIKELSSKVKIKKISRVYETYPWGFTEQDNFLNLCLLAEVELDVLDLLEFCQDVEKKLGRKKRFKWGPREIDIDILFCDQLVIKEENLILPHPYMLARDFVLFPLYEIAPNWIHPLTGDSLDTVVNQRKSSAKFASIKEYDFFHNTICQLNPEENE